RPLPSYSIATVGWSGRGAGRHAALEGRPAYGHGRFVFRGARLHARGALLPTLGLTVHHTFPERRRRPAGAVPDPVGAGRNTGRGGREGLGVGVPRRDNGPANRCGACQHAKHSVHESHGSSFRAPITSAAALPRSAPVVVTELPERATGLGTRYRG